MRTLIQKYEQRGAIVSLFDQGNGYYEATYSQGCTARCSLIVTEDKNEALVRFHKRVATVKAAYERRAA